MVDIPTSLADAVRAGNAVLFAGAGMSAAAGLPGWSQLLTGMIQFAADERITLDAAGVAQLIADKDLLTAAQVLHDALGSDRVAKYLKRVYGDPGLKPTAVHNAIRGIPFAAVVTTNYDRLIEQALGARVYTNRHEYELANWNDTKEFAVIKTHGDIDDAASIVLTEQSYRAAKFGQTPVRNFLDTLFSSMTVVFAGCSMGDPDLGLILEQLQATTGGHRKPHFALMRMAKVKRGPFRDKYGITVIDDGDAGHPDIAAFLDALPHGKRSAAPAPVAVSAVDGAAIRRTLEAMGLRSLAEQSPFFLGSYRAGLDIRRVIVRYHESIPSEGDIEALHQGKVTNRLDEAWLMMEPAITGDIRRLAELRDVRIMQREGCVFRVMDFGPCLQSLRDDPENARIERLFVPLNAREKPDGPVVPLDDLVERWMAGEGRHLSLLGDFGTGKSWFCRRLARRLADAGGRIPILVSLRDYWRTFNARQMITDVFLNQYGVTLPHAFETFQYLNEEGRLLIVCDGFDEMERRAANYQPAFDNFMEIASLATGKAKVLLTCRTTFFRTEQEEDKIVGRRGEPVRLMQRENVIKLEEGFERAYLQEFDEPKIQQALELRHPGRGQELLARIQGVQKLESLASRPVMLEMVAQTLDSFTAGERLNLATLYQQYTEKLLADRPTEGIELPGRIAFIREMAWDMQSANKLALHYSEFPERVKNHFGLKGSAEDIVFLDDRMRVESLLKRDAAGNYEFAHKSFLEYFVACRLAERLREGRGTDIPLTDAIVSFVHAILGETYPYQREVRAGMVHVPAGPFIFGDEGESNLVVAAIEKDFWIDRYPVTNAQFFAFLERAGNKKEGGASWLDHELSRIKSHGKKFVMEPGYEQHPVTGVTWYGARAYAKSLGRQLPTEQQWEKAMRGVDGRVYPWGDDFDSGRCDTAEGGKRDTTAVGSFGEAGASPYGCEDGSGNVWEWTSSPYQEGSSEMAVRGGSWGDNARYARCAYRDDVHPHHRNYNIGLRCART